MNIPKVTGFARFFQSNVSGSILLIIATVLAMVMANTDLRSYYEAFCDMRVSIGLGGRDLLSHSGYPMTLELFVNDILMAIFFFAVGLEIKREVLVGELSSPRRALLPIIAAVGGIICPIIIFYLISKGTPAQAGIAIPMATDIAFSLGVLSLLGKRVPAGLKIFLTALAVADDLGGILVIAIFYASHISLLYLIIAAFVAVMMFIVGRKGVNNPWVYLSLGMVLWFMVYNSGVHSTIAGVIAAFAIPARPQLNINKYFAKMRNNLHRFPEKVERDKNGISLLTHGQISILHRIERYSNKVISPLQRIEDMLHPLVTFGIIPIFAFVNAGVVLGDVTTQTLMSETTLGCLLGLFFGKFIGIFLFSYIAIKSHIVLIPKGSNLKQIAAVSILGGIGFTVSLFIANLSFGDTAEGLKLLNEAKIGILSGSILASVIGYIVLRITIKDVEPTEEYEESEDDTE